MSGADAWTHVTGMRSTTVGRVDVAAEAAAGIVGHGVGHRGGRIRIRRAQIADARIALIHPCGIIGKKQTV